MEIAMIVLRCGYRLERCFLQCKICAPNYSFLEGAEEGPHDVKIWLAVSPDISIADLSSRVLDKT